MLWPNTCREKNKLLTESCYRMVHPGETNILVGLLNIASSPTHTTDGSPPFQDLSMILKPHESSLATSKLYRAAEKVLDSRTHKARSSHHQWTWATFGETLEWNNWVGDEASSGERPGMLLNIHSKEPPTPPAKNELALNMRAPKEKSPSVSGWKVICQVQVSISSWATGNSTTGFF